MSEPGQSWPDALDYVLLVLICACLLLLIYHLRTGPQVAMATPDTGHPINEDIDDIRKGEPPWA